MRAQPGWSEVNGSEPDGTGCTELYCVLREFRVSCVIIVNSLRTCKPRLMLYAYLQACISSVFACCLLVVACFVRVSSDRHAFRRGRGCCSDEATNEGALVCGVRELAISW